MAVEREMADDASCDGPSAIKTTVAASDGFELAARLYPSRGLLPKGVAIFMNAVGADQSKFAAFARYLAQRGWNAITFDYRGIGDSLSVDPEAELSMLSWGEKDLAAVLRWATSRFDGAKVVLICQSIGGQVAPFAKNVDEVDAFLLIASQKGYWRNWPDWRRYLVWLFFRVYIPVCLRVLNRVPLPATGLHPLPRGVALDYARWTLRPDYVGADGAQLDKAFGTIKAPLLSLSFEDDRLYAPRRAVDDLAKRFYANAQAFRAHIDPKAFGARLGHSGFFDDGRCPRALWRDVERWMRFAVVKEAQLCQFEVLELKSAEAARR